MRYLHIIAALMTGILVQAQLSSQKTYQASVYFKKTTTNNSSFISDPAIVMSEVTYFDGLGRPVQQNQIKRMPAEKDLVTHIEYTLNGNRIKDFLPVPIAGLSGGFASDALNTTLNYYNVPSFDYTKNPYSEKLLEKAPGGKVLAQGAPGNDWNVNNTSNNHAIKFDYRINRQEDAVKKYVVSTNYHELFKFYENNIAFSGVYPENELYKIITKNENWVSGKDNTTEEYKNKLGQIVLKRTYNLEVAHDTYYIYDKFGNLVYVIPPLANGDISPSTLNSLCYTYTYDYRNRLVQKKLPGKEMEFMIYDQADRLVAEGPVLDPFGGSQRGWLITKYDVFNRTVYTGYYNGLSTDFANSIYLRNWLGTQVTMNESKSSGDNIISGASVRYTNTVEPISSLQLLTVNYYDDYNYPGAPTSFAAIEGVVPIQKVNNQQTGNWVRTLSSSASSNGSISYKLYDDKYRIIKTAKFLSEVSYTQVEFQLNFRGLVLKKTTKNKLNNNTQETIVTEKFDYDHAERLLKHQHKVNNNPEESLVDITYDDLGNLITKKVGGYVGATLPLQKVDYKYNIRGWLTDINDVSFSNTENDLFSYKLYYNKYKTTSFSPAQLINDISFNGNITFAENRTKHDNIRKGYKYTYDKLSRLTDSGYYEGDILYSKLPKSEFREAITYDKNGNIMRAYRLGKEIDGQEVEIDDLVYTYEGNKLIKVMDATANPEGFNDGNNTGIDYSYDGFGNLISDLNKKISSISYNHMNLPCEITFPFGKIKYTYDALGTRMSKLVLFDGEEPLVVFYMDGFQYVLNTLKFFPTSEGYVRYNNNQYSYVYNYTDHLGSVRLSYEDINKNGAIEPTEIVEVNDYYPFGLKHQNLNTLTNSNWYNYKFNGKELQDEFGLNLYDFGARNYDPALGRWMNVDPLAEKMRRHSPYNYAFNNPVYFIDPDGMAPDDWFVNIKSGAVVYLKGKSSFSQDFANKKGLGDVNNWTSLGGDNLLGNEVYYGGRDNILNDNFVKIEGSSVAFMERNGFSAAEKVLIKEREITSGGRMTPGENITIKDYSLKQIGESELTYVKPDKINNKKYLEKTSSSGPYSSIESVTYEINKPVNQSNNKTAHFYGNKKGDMIGVGATVINELINIIKSIF